MDQSGVADGREYVSKAEAMTRFRRQFTDLAALTTDLGDNPFPASLEVRVRPGAEGNGRADALVKQVATLPGVADVRYDREWLARMASGLNALRGAGFALAFLMAVAAAVTVAAVVRLGLHNLRREEIDIMKLVGHPCFHPGPFIAEGLLQGGFGAVVAPKLLWLGFKAVGTWVSADLTAILDGASLQFLPPASHPAGGRGCLWARGVCRIASRDVICRVARPRRSALTVSEGAVTLKEIRYMSASRSRYRFLADSARSVILYSIPSQISTEKSSSLPALPRTAARVLFRGCHHRR